ncbi:MAG: DUF1330 domain-containing protein [Deltaproteobacteria bacterium]|nr:DUF1330 domain-containing protein [Deltaproteobacteria bacterium]
MGNLTPSKDQLNELTNSNYKGPVVMVNLLKFKRVDGKTNESYKSYQKYMHKTAPFLKKVNGKLIYIGELAQVFIGDDSDNWDLCLLVKYPSGKAFIEMITDQEYLKIQNYRENSLENSALLVTKPTIGNL